MADRLARDVWVFRALFVGVALVLLFARMLPLGSAAGQWPGPDLMLCVILAWVMRRPDVLPVGLIVAVVLLEDLILMRPPGLWTALVVLATEFLRARAALTRELTFTVEWLLVTGLMVGLLLVNRSVFAIAFLPQPGFGFVALQTAWSILCYPLVVGVSRLAIDLRRPAPGETNSYGRRR